MCSLIARWGAEQDPLTELPKTIVWGDERPATIEEYERHYSDTHELVLTPEGLERRMYPWRVADVRFDAYTRLWFLMRPDEQPVALGISHPDASDEVIRCELCDFPIVWKARIWRGGTFTWSSGEHVK